MTKYLRPQPVPQVEAGDLLLLLAARDARMVAVTEGTLSQDALERWEEGLSEAQRRALDDFDALIRANLKRLRVMLQAGGV